VIKRIGRKILTPCLGRPRLQGAFQALVEVGYAGLNVGEGNHPAASGEREAAEAIRSLLGHRAREAVLFDVGANVGDYTSILLDVFGPNSKTWTFEPSQSTFSILERRHGDTDRVTLRNIGFSDRPGTGVLRAPGEGSKLGSLHDTHSRLEPQGLPLVVEETVTLESIDSFCASEHIDRIDFVKLDVEGHELHILRGAARMLAEGRITAIQFEFGGANIDSRSFMRDFFDLLTPQYAIYRVLQHGLFPIARYDVTLEVFKRATNYVAVLGEVVAPAP
jgi:FkbM family methyltransferase